MAATMLQSDEHKPVEITKNACGSKSYFRPHRYLHNKTMQNSKSRQKCTFPLFPHFLMDFPIFRPHGMATLVMHQSAKVSV